MTNIFDGVYQFTTEEISKYFPVLDLKGKDVLTVGSSGDQAFTSLLLGAGKVTLYDICPNTYEFVKLKKDIILKYPREKAFIETIKIDQVPSNKDIYPYTDIVKMNPCFSSDENYELLRDKLKNNEIEFIVGDIFKMNNYLDDLKYDRIILSNILQYIDYFSRINGYEGRDKEFLSLKFKDWINHLNIDGLIQLAYIYDSNLQKLDIFNICESLKKYDLYKYSFVDNYKRDSSIIVYRKK